MQDQEHLNVGYAPPGSVIPTTDLDQDLKNCIEYAVQCGHYQSLLGIFAIQIIRELQRLTMLIRLLLARMAQSETP